MPDEPVPAPAPVAAPAPSTPAPPPAAEIVKTGEQTEEVNTLRQQLKEERDARKKAETDHAHLQDAHHRLRESLKAAPKKKGGFGFFRED